MASDLCVINEVETVLKFIPTLVMMSPTCSLASWAAIPSGRI